MASVWLAHDDELDRVVALKLLAEHFASEPGLRDRFLREARIAAALSHPNLVRVYDIGEHEGRPYIVMEHVRGASLAGRRLGANEVTRIARQVCAGLEHAHAQGVVHRDLKPHNLLERDDGVVKIADFGIARAASLTRITEVGTVLGTAEYLAPEQAAGQEVTEKADVYALGATLYELLSGRPPTPGTTEPPSGAPAPLEDAIMRCLARDPLYRPSASELRTLLDDASAADPLGRPAEPRTTRILARRPARRIWPVAATVAALLLLAGATAFALERRGDDGSPPRSVNPVRPVPHARTAQEQAQNLARWLERYSR
jgi:serine/threonine protein kinase